MKRVTAREFQHHFGKLAAALKPGESIQVTRQGKVAGIYHKPPERKIPFPDYRQRLSQHDYDEAAGNALLGTLDATLS